MSDDSDDTQPEFLVRLQESKDWPAIEGLIRHLRRLHPRFIQTADLGVAVGRPKRQVYGLIKLARRYLALTTGEAVPNVRKVGYQIDNRPRAHLFESIKSGNRADGHLAAEGMSFRRVSRESLTSTEDVELFVAQQARIRLGEARLALSEDVAPAMRRLERNATMAAAASRDALTPWKDIGLDDPDGAN